MTFQEFIDKYNGKPVDTDGVYPNQCMDLMHAYLRDVHGIPLSALAAPSAYQAYVNNNRPDLFEKIPNTPSGVPQRGDVMFWNTKVGQYGHVAVYIDGDVNKFRSFDANWPLGSLCHVQPHDYTGVAGWLRVKSATPPPPPPPPPVDVDGEQQKQIDQLKKDVIATNDRINALNERVNRHIAA